MLNSIVKIITNKNIILITYHRNTLPIIRNEINKKKFIFINLLYIWRVLPLPGKYKFKYIIVYWLLNLISPFYIIDINWISKWQSLYKVWTKKHPLSKFIVIQHGSYYGGIIRDNSHRFTKCDIFLCWSDYFNDYFKNVNKGKKVQILTFGNSIYNQFKRDEIAQKKNSSGKILLLPTAIKKEKIAIYNKLIKLLNNLGFTVYLKPHVFQGRDEHFPSFEYVCTINCNIYNLLKNNDFDFVVSDNSTALLDAIFFKNKVLFFAPPDNICETVSNIYSEYLENIYNKMNNLRLIEDIFRIVDLEKQEELLKKLVNPGNNDLTRLKSIIK